MALYTISGCGEEEVAHVCTGCPDIENGRVRSVAFERSTNTWADIEDPTEWETKMDAGDVIVIPETNGTSDGGAPKYLPGYGDKKERYINTTTTFNFKDPDYEPNRGFYNAKLKSGSWMPIFRTGSLLHRYAETCSIVAKDPVEDDVESEVVWAVEVKVTHQDLATLSAVPDGIFDQCYGDTD